MLSLNIVDKVEDFHAARKRRVKHVTWVGSSRFLERPSGYQPCLPPLRPGINSRPRGRMWAEFQSISVRPRGFSPGIPAFRPYQNRLSKDSCSQSITSCCGRIPSTAITSGILPFHWAEWIKLLLNWYSLKFVRFVPFFPFLSTM